MQAAVGDGARVHPARKDSADRAPELLLRVLRERLAELLLDLRLVERDHMRASRPAESSVSSSWPRRRLLVLEDLLEDLVVEPEHDVGIHLDEAAVAVIGEARVAGVGAPAPRPSRR